MDHPLTERKKARQAEFFQLVSEGFSQAEACRKIGVTQQTLKNWRQNEVGWGERIERAREKARRDEPDSLVVQDFATFRRQYFGFETPWVHAEIAHKLEYSPQGSVTLILVPPETGKTTIITDFVCRQLAIYPNDRILWFCKNQNQSRKRVNRVKRRMTERGMGAKIDAYQSRYGPFYVDGQERAGKPWSADYITVYGADHDEQDYSLEALGITSSVYGARADKIVLDDVQTMDNINQTDQLIEKYSQDIATRALHGHVIIIGTMMPFYEELLKRGQITDYIIYPAIRNGEPLVPYDEKTGFGFTLESLAQIRKNVGEDVWARAFMMNPKKRPGNSFSEAAIEGAKKLDLTVAGFDRDIGFGMERRVVTCDPALGGGCGIMAMGVSPTRLRIYDCQVDYNLGRNEEIYERIETFAHRYKPQTVVFETSALQKGMARSDALTTMAKELGFEIEEHLTGVNKYDPKLGVKEMAGSFVKGEIWIPWGDDFTKQRMDDLIGELGAWRPDIPARLLVQNLVMALWFGWLYWQRSKGDEPMDLSAWRRRGVPYGRPLVASRRDQ